jgi:WD40 repeat protein
MDGTDGLPPFGESMEYDGPGPAQIELWSVPEGDVVRTIQGNVVQPKRDSPAILPGGILPVSYRVSANDHELHLWDLESLSVARKVRGFRFPVRRVAIAADGSTLATFSDKNPIDSFGLLQIWDLPSDHVLSSCEVAVCDSLELAPDGKTFIVDENNRITFRDATDGRVLQSRQVPAPSFRSGAVRWTGYLSDGTALVAVGYHRILFDEEDEQAHDDLPRIIDLRTGKEWQPLQVPPPNLTCLAVSRDRGLVAAGSDDGSVKLYDVNNRQLTTLPVSTPLGEVISVTVSADGNYVAVFSRSGLRVWEVQSHRQIALNARGFIGEFSPNGRNLSTQWFDIRNSTWTSSSTIWDLPSGKRRPFVKW